MFRRFMMSAALIAAVCVAAGTSLFAGDKAATPAVTDTSATAGVAKDAVNAAFETTLTEGVNVLEVIALDGTNTVTSSLTVSYVV